MIQKEYNQVDDIFAAKAFASYFPGPISYHNTKQV